MGFIINLEKFVKFDFVLPNTFRYFGNIILCERDYKNEDLNKVLNFLKVNKIPYSLNLN